MDEKTEEKNDILHSRGSKAVNKKKQEKYT